MSSAIDNSVDIAEVDPFSDEILHDPYPYYAALRDTAPAVWLRRYNVWAVSRYADVRSVLRDFRTFSSASGVALRDDVNEKLGGSGALTSDPPVHGEMRRILSDLISTRPIESFVPAINMRAARLVDALVDRGSFDVVADLSATFSVTTVSDFIGLPYDGRERLLSLSDAMFNNQGPNNSRNLSSIGQVDEFWAYGGALIAANRFTEGSWGEAIMAGARAGQYPMEWAAASILAFIVAGMDTTMNAMSTAIWLFAKNPDQWEKLRSDPTLALAGFAEAIRCESPIQWFTRVTTEKCDVDGVTIPENARVMVIYGSANRDERVFQRASDFDIQRKGGNHLGFGFGVHQCVGQALARAEGSAVLTALARRVPSIDLVSERRHLNNTLRGFGSIEVRVA